ncbi:MAG: MarR family winged helix-turn-helix transcriptional regulator [Pseudonocardia sp.]
MENRDLMLALRALVMATERERVRMAREVLGIGVNEIVACSYIALSGPRTPSEIADRLRITTASVTELIDRLERAGLVSRGRHPSDRRKLLITLTADGRRKSLLIQERFTGLLTRAATGLSLDERHVVLRFLNTAAQTIAAGGPGAPDVREDAKSLLHPDAGPDNLVS